MTSHLPQVSHQNADAPAFFHTADAEAYADVQIGGHRETWAVRSGRFQQLVSQQFATNSGQWPSANAVNTILRQFTAEALLNGPERQVHVRVAEHGGCIYLDLADPHWRVVKVTPQGWSITDDVPIRFRRVPGMLALPVPTAGASITELRSFLNLATDDDFTNVASWLLGSLRGRGPYPCLLVTGEQGSAKSTFSRLLRSLIDPNVAPLRSLPTSERNLLIAAKNSHIQAFDNLSGITTATSDALCRLSTGGAFAVRRLFSDDNEMLIDVTKPVLLNAIDNIILRPDLADRAVIVVLNPIPEHRRRTEDELLKRFEQARSGLLGALLSTMAHGLRSLSSVADSHLPRMADYAKWGIACETAYTHQGDFTRAYSANRAVMVADSIEADAVALAIRRLVDANKNWKGTATELVAVLHRLAGGLRTRGPDWPSTPRALAGRLRQLAPVLRAVGIEVHFERETSRQRNRIVTIQSVAASSETSGPSVTNQKAA